MSIHRRNPTTGRHGGFDLLRFRPGPVHPSLDDLVVSGSQRSTISIPNLVRTPDRHSPLQLRTPELKRSSSLSLPVTWITGTRHSTRRGKRAFTGVLEFNDGDVTKKQTAASNDEKRCTTVSIHRRDPTTERHGGFDLLRFRPGPVHPSLDDLVVSGSPRSTISIPNLVRTPDRHSPLQLRTPELKRSTSLSLPVTWITGARHRTRRGKRAFTGVLEFNDGDVTKKQTAASNDEKRCTTVSIHRRDPTTERHGGFDLLRFRPGPVHPSLDDLVVPGSPRSTISIANLVRTPDRHSPLQLRTPELKRSTSLSLPVTWITGERHRTRRGKRAFTGVLEFNDGDVTKKQTAASNDEKRCTTVSIHRRDPTTERHGGFDLLRFRPGPVHTSLDDLVVSGSPRSTISIPNLVQTPDRHSPLQLRTPELKRSASLSLPVTWITGARHGTRREIIAFIGVLEFNDGDVTNKHTARSSYLATKVYQAH
ncbi:hypothetical protein NQZ68_005263 [Scomber scombrus]|uniref:Uncharacterized protein n=1 Tax=Scomber scombrus TaxID=13677 RepID=A0AAV1MYJ7_SCOSC